MENLANPKSDKNTLLPTLEGVTPQKSMLSVDERPPLLSSQPSKVESSRDFTPNMSRTPSSSVIKSGMIFLLSTPVISQ